MQSLEPAIYEVRAQGVKLSADRNTREPDAGTAGADRVASCARVDSLRETGFSSS